MVGGEAEVLAGFGKEVEGRVVVGGEGESVGEEGSAESLEVAGAEAELAVAEG